MSNREIPELIADVREQVLYLQELGVELLDAELPEITTAVRAQSVMPKAVEAVITAPPPNIEFAKRPAPQRASGERISSLPSLKKRTKPPEDMVLKMAAEVPSNMVPSEEQKPTVPVVQVVDQSNDTIESICAEIGDCTRCKLCAGRTQIVHTTGNFGAELMFVGEAPGADEDVQGVPFVGRAGQLLTKIIESIGMKREEVCIGNINRCRPPKNRQPEPDETATCRPFILREIAVIKPKVVVVLGATAAHNLLQVKTPISKLRGNFHDYFGVKVMPTFHPAYLLRDPHKKREVWDDMKKVRDFLVSGLQ